MTISVLLLGLQTLAAPFTLEQAIGRARDSASTARSARERVEEERQNRKQAFSRLLPKVELTASQLEQSANMVTYGIHLPGDQYVPFYSIQDVRVEGSVSLFNAQVWKYQEDARLAVATRELETHAVGSIAALQGGLAWTEAARATALLKDREDGVALARRLRNLTEEQMKAGAATRLDLVRAQVQETQALRLLSQARQALDKALHQMGRILQSTDENLGISGELPLQPAIATDVHEKGEVAAIRAASAGREQAQSAVQTARADFLPTVGAFADYGYIGTRLDKDGLWTGKVGVQVRWSVFEGGDREAKIEKARVRERLAAIAERDARIGAQQERLDAQSAVTETTEQLKQAISASALADTELVLAQEKFKAGASGNAEVVQAQGSRSNAHAGWIDAAGAHQAALLRLRYALGEWDEQEKAQ
jgi:outer membrane protein